MCREPETRSHFLLFFAWPILGLLAWGLTYWNLIITGLDSLSEVVPTIFRFAYTGFIAGAILGCGQLLILKKRGIGLIRFSLITSVAYGIGFCIGISVEIIFLVGLLHRMGMGGLVEGQTFISPSPVITLLFAGAFAGTAQIILFRSSFHLSLSASLLWILGNMAALGIGWLIGEAIIGGMNLSHIYSGVPMGLVFGTVMGIIALVLSRVDWLKIRCNTVAV